MNIKRVLFTGARAPAALELARQFNAAGIEVYIAESLPWHLGRLSRVVKKSFQVSAPRQQPECFISELAQIVLKYSIDLIIPTCEETFTIARYRDRLPCAVLVDEFDKILKFHHKYRFIECARSYGLGVPYTDILTSKAEVWARVQAKPHVVAKPVYSRFGSEAILCALGEKEIQKLNSIECSPGRPWVVQQFIEGRAICSYSVAHQGQLLAHTSYQGSYFAGKATIDFRYDSNAAVQAWVEAFVRAENVSGQISFDFIQASDGQVYAIECNPRTTSGVHTFEPHEGLVLALCREGRPSLLVPTGKRRAHLGLAMLIYGLSDVKSFRDALRWLKSFMGHQDVVLNWKDPLPAVGQWLTYLNLGVRAQRLGITAIAASTYDIEWNGDSK